MLVSSSWLRRLRCRRPIPAIKNTVTRRLTSGNPDSFKSNRITINQKSKLCPSYDVVVVGSGVNALASAAYLQKNGLRVALFERRAQIGGTLATEELYPGFRCNRLTSRCGLVSPQIVAELEIQNRGVKTYPCATLTPFHELMWSGKNKPDFLYLGYDHDENQREIAKFSHEDAQAYIKYVRNMERMIQVITPLFHAPPTPLTTLIKGGQGQGTTAVKLLDKVFRQLINNHQNDSLNDESVIGDFYELVFGSVGEFIEERFQSDPLMSTLSYGGIHGTNLSTKDIGTGYKFLHNMIGGPGWIRSTWDYGPGGIGSVAEAIAATAVDYGAHLFNHTTVKEISLDTQGGCKGVVLHDDTEVKAKVVVSGATASVTFKSMLKDQLPMSIVQQISNITYSPSFSKINVAVNKLPAFKFLRSPSTTTTTTRVVTHFHRASILLNCELMEDLVAAQKEAEEQKTYSSKPLIQMTIPSVVDQTLSPWGSHVVELTCHYTPYSPAPGKVWDSNVKNEYANKVFDQVEHYCPGFWESIIAFDILTPPDMEHEYSLTGGAATHSDLTVDQIYFNRPSPHFSDYRTPISGLYLCGSDSHPGHGIIGTCGRLTAQTVLQDFTKLFLGV